MLSPYSALSLVRSRIHALRQSTELLMKLTYFVGRRIQRYAWFNSGYKFMRQTTAGFAGSVLFFPLVRPMMRRIMAGMDQEYSYVGVAWWETVEIPQLQFIAG